ncbi:hypothetical protein DVH24_029857 [Malus domestica]|uniref:Uncharacterized protein n=1 Tax=Malus domestica TaxID=3750 RepID=A0A498HUK4_MALDO|nr:hypothetical protein DVH24_029857 [Malus domestica]
MAEMTQSTRSSSEMMKSMSSSLEMKPRSKVVSSKSTSGRKCRTQCTRFSLYTGSGRGEYRLALPPFMERLLPSLESETYRSWTKALAIAPSATSTYIYFEPNNVYIFYITFGLIEVKKIVVRSRRVLCNLDGHGTPKVPRIKIANCTDGAFCKLKKFVGSR